MPDLQTETLPILDLSELDEAANRRQAFLARLRETAHGIGFFYVSGHGVPQHLIRDVLAQSRQFFALKLPKNVQGKATAGSASVAGSSC